MLQKAVHFARIAQRMAIVRSQTIFEALCLADVYGLTVGVLHQVDARFGREVSLPGGIEEEAAIGARRRLHFFRELAIGAPLVNLFGNGGVGDIATPGNGQLQTAA